MMLIRITTLCVLLAVSLNALIASYLFIMDPSGGNLHISIDLLKHSPFKNYFIPGLILFTCIGLFSLLTILLIIFKSKFYPIAIILQAAIILGWIIIQITLLQELNFLHIAFIILSLMLIVFGVIINLKKN